MTYAPGRLDFLLLLAMIMGMAIEVALFTKLIRAPGRGSRDESRLPTYRYFVVYQWALVAAMALLWIADKRPWSQLLLGRPHSLGFAICFVVAVAYPIVATKQRRALASRPELPEALRTQLRLTEGITPCTPGERELWTFVAITAGVCEEVFFRGFLLTFVASYTGLVAAVAITAMLFGLYHAYYGWPGMLKTAGLGLVFALIVLWSGSLIPAMILHVTIDLMSGDIAYHVLMRSPVATGAERPRE
jgi:membrane protease YdiL (CAAX protease family)